MSIDRQTSQETDDNKNDVNQWAHKKPKITEFPRIRKAPVKNKPSRNPGRLRYCDRVMVI